MASDRDQKLPSYANEKLNSDEKRGDFLNEGGERNGASAVEQPKKMWPGKYYHCIRVLLRLAVLPRWIRLDVAALRCRC